MGLDMYLSARVSSYKSYEGEAPEDRARRAKVEEAAEAMGLPRVADNIDTITISREVAYWRKANQIHAWFVANVQGGVDECQESYVQRGQLVALRDLCAALIESKDTAKAAELLPPQSGFFFGSTDVDEWYWRSLEHTVEQLDRAIKLPEAVDFYYQASW